MTFIYGSVSKNETNAVNMVGRLQSEINKKYTNSSIGDPFASPYFTSCKSLRGEDGIIHARKFIKLQEFI